MAMLKLLTNEAIRYNKKRNLLELISRFFTRPFKELDSNIRKVLKSPPEGPYMNVSLRNCFKVEKVSLFFLRI